MLGDGYTCKLIGKELMIQSCLPLLHSNLRACLVATAKHQEQDYQCRGDRWCEAVTDGPVPGGDGNDANGFLNPAVDRNRSMLLLDAEGFFIFLSSTSGATQRWYNNKKTPPDRAYSDSLWSMFRRIRCYCVL